MMASNDNTPPSAAEVIAYKLMQHIASVERRSFFHNPGDQTSAADRQWILDTYAECLCVVKNERPRRRPE
jgi:hypothetical protein